MAGGPIDLFEVPYERLFPWIRLFRAVRIAFDLKKLLLSALGLVLLHVGWEGLGRLFPGVGAISPLADPARVAAAGLSPYDARSRPIAPAPLLPPGLAFPPDRSSVGADVRSAPWRTTEPVRYLVGPFLAVFDPGSDWSTFFHALLAAVWGVIVWGLLGGAVCRIALAEATRSESVGMLTACRFALRKGVTLVGSPLLPLIVVAVLTLLCSLIGLLYRVPGGFGPAAGGLLLVLPLLAALVLAIVLLGLAAAWPLMPPAVAADGGDGFEALSRSYGYLNRRRGYYLFLVLLAWAVGIVGLVFVDLFARVVVQLAYWTLSFSAPRELLASLFGAGTGHVPPAAEVVHTFWLSFVGVLAHAWIFSYFWTSATLIYLTLRHSVDGTPFHELSWLDASPEPPVGTEGIPADDHPGAEQVGTATATPPEQPPS
jgi:hypothetical protein